MKSIVQLSTVHSRQSIRIFLKYCKTLGQVWPGQVVFVVADGLGDKHAKSLDEISVLDLDHLGRGRISRMLNGSIRAFKLLIKNKPDIVHFHDPELIPVGLLLKIFGCKIIYDVHEDVPRQIMSKKWIPLWARGTTAKTMQVVEWFGAKMFDAIVTATPKIAERFPKDKTVLVQNYPITGELFPNNAIPHRKRSPIMNYVGIITKTRGVVEIVKAIGLIDPKVGARLELAGNISPESLSNELKALPEWDLIRHHGYISRKEVSDLLGRSRLGLVTIHPEANHINAQPIKMFEYMSAGLPVIGSDFPLWREIIYKNKCGLLVDPQKPEDIAEAMTWILEHPEEGQAMGENGRMAVQREFNWEMESKKLINLYDKLLNN